MFPSRRITMGGDVFRDEYSLAFDGSNDYVDLPLGDLADDTVGSICLWVKTTASGSLDVMVAGSNDGDASSDLTISKNASEKLWVFVRNDGSQLLEFTSTASLVQNRWYYIVFTVGSSSNAIYIDGVLAAGTYNTGDATTQKWFNDVGGLDTLRIANREDSGGDEYHWPGNISEVVFYGSSLSASQVRTIYNNREPYNHKEGILSNNLEAWYRMGDGILDHKQANGLIADQTDATLGAELITGFTQGDTYPFNTLTTSGRDISSAIETSGNWGGCVSNQLNITVGEVYKCTFNLTYNSGDDTVRFLLASGDSGGSTTRSTVRYSNTSGINTMYFLVTATDSTSYFQIGTWHETDEINFSATNISLKKVGGNSGIMVNMDAVDFTGDTP